MNETTTMTTARAAERARRFPELQSLVRGLVFAWRGDDDVPELHAARRWLNAHCRACGATIAETKNRREFCAACQAEFRHTRAGGKG